MQILRQTSKGNGELPATGRPRWKGFPVILLITFALLLGKAAPGFAQAIPSWMQDKQSTIQTVPLKGIAMPGTHDTFSYLINTFRNSLDGTYASFFQTQDLDIREQLIYGVRHFDMRTYLLDGNGIIVGGTPCTNAPSAASLTGPGYYMYIHGGACTGIKLDDVLDQISSFLDAYPQEIILLHFSGNIQAGSPTYATSAAFEAVLDKHLRRHSDGASYVYDHGTACRLSGLPWTSNTASSYYPTAPYAGVCEDQQGRVGVGVIPQEVTPQQLYTTPARVIAFEEFGLTGVYSSGDYASLTWPDWAFQAPPPYPPGNAETSGGYIPPGAADNSLLDSYLEYGAPGTFLGLYGTRPIGAGYESDRKFLNLQANLTPGGSGFLIANPPMDSATAYNPHLESVLQTAWVPYSINIVQVDNVDYCAPTAVVGRCATVAYDIVNFNNYTFGRVPFGTTGASQISISANGTVYKLGSTDGSGSGPLGQNHTLWKRTGNNGYVSDWTALTAAGNRIAADPSGNVWILDDTGYLFRLNADGSIFQNFSLFELQDIAVDNKGTLYGVIRSLNLPEVYSGDGWQILPGLNNAVRIAANNSVIAVLDTNGNVQEYNGNGGWTPLNQPFKATSIAVDDTGHIWATQAEKAVGAYSGYTPVPTSGLWVRLNTVWQQFRTDGVQVATSTVGNGFSMTYVIDKAGNTHNCQFRSFPNQNQGQGAAPKRYAPQIAVSGLTFNHATQIFSGTLTVTNNTGSAITDQLAVLFQGLPSGVTIANNPVSYQGEPFILMPAGTLQPNASVSTQVQFLNPDLSRITYSNLVYAYVPGN